MARTRRVRAEAQGLTVPTSILEGKAWLAPHITELQPATILDIGAGEGTYATLLRPLLPDARFVGVEIWEPYSATYSLDGLYDEVLIGDARTMVLPTADVVILGDVLEHMTHDEALTLWQRCRSLAGLAVFASIPIIYAPQGAVNGNSHETHVHTWTHAEGLALPGVCAAWAGHVIGCYQAGPA
jgi:2-polyprenyl-3-methyl-5-hydroxy-6-metoxy-1,4-benzoquinol methylase